jgi:hypothetical protein
MKSSRKIIVLSALIFTLLALHYAPFQQGNAVIQSHHPLVIQGHSPIDIVVTDPNHLQTGCVNGKSVTNIPNSTFSGCGTEPETVTIADPIVGVYTVQYVGTGNGQFTITSVTCVENNHDSNNKGHSEVCGSDPDDKIISEISFTGTASVGSTGITGFNLNSDGTLNSFNTVPVSISLVPDPMSNPISTSNYFTVSYSFGGSPASANIAGGTSTIQVDPNTDVTISGASSASNSYGEEWCFASGCPTLTFGSGTTGVSETFVYYDVLSQSVSYSIVGGGTPSVPLSYVGMPSSASSSDSPTVQSISLSVSPQEIQPIRGSLATVQAIVAGEAGERWVALGQTSWTITSSNVITNPVVYYHQYLVTFAQSGLDTSAMGTIVSVQVGSPATSLSFSTLPYTHWENATSSISYTFYSPVASSNSGEQFRLSQVTGPSSSFTPSAPTVVTGTYVPQYEVTFETTGLDSSALGAVLSAEVNSYSFTSLPVTLWVDYNGLSYSYVTPISNGIAMERFNLSSTTGPASGSTLSSPATIVGNYVLQYEVNFTVFKDGWGLTSPGLGTQWLNSGATYPISAFPNSGYVFQGWHANTCKLVIADPDDQSTTVTVNGPGMITAKFTPSVKITLSPSTGSVSPGNKITTVATISGGSQCIRLSIANAEKLPEGIWITFAYNQITDSPTGVTVTITISASHCLAPGTYSIIIQALGSNGKLAQAIYTLIVT